MAKMTRDLSSVPAYADLEKIRASVKELTAQLEQCKQETVQTLYTIAIQTEDVLPLRDEVIQQVYWSEEITSTEIAEIFGLQLNAIAKIAAVGYSTKIPCNQCKQPKIVSVTSKSHFKNLQRDRKSYICKDCKSEQAQESDERYKEYARHARERMEELHVMPYKQYLQSPEWQQRRKDQLRRANYRCQVCNYSDTVLDVHHRTYERRGNENQRDLIVLCRNCHSIFHKQGKLED